MKLLGEEWSSSIVVVVQEEKRRLLLSSPLCAATSSLCVGEEGSLGDLVGVTQVEEE